MCAMYFDCPVVRALLLLQNIGRTLALGGEDISALDYCANADQCDIVTWAISGCSVAATGSACGTARMGMFGVVVEGVRSETVYDVDDNFVGVRHYTQLTYTNATATLDFEVRTCMFVC